MNAWLLDVSSAIVPMATDSDTPWFLLLAGPAGAIAVYWGLFVYYRNTDKSHAFEKDTHIESEPVNAHDRKVNKVKGTERSEVQGNNVDRHRDRVRRLH